MIAYFGAWYPSRRPKAEKMRISVLVSEHDTPFREKICLKINAFRSIIPQFSK